MIGISRSGNTRGGIKHQAATIARQGRPQKRFDSVT
jgi:hypothetical protein